MDVANPVCRSPACIQEYAVKIKNLAEIQKMNQAGVDTAIKLVGDWNKTWQVIAAEMGDYTKCSLDDGSQTFEKLLTAKSMEQVLEIQTAFAKRACDQYMTQLTKVGSIYADLAKEACRPLERVMQGGR